MNISGKWQGTLVYGEGYDEETVGKTLDFEFDITDNDGEISATGKDISGHGYNPSKFKLTGFVDDGIISFIKEYEIGIIVHGDGKTEELPAENNYEVNYSGHYNQDTNEFQGDWEIAGYIQDEEFPDEWIPHLCTGTWKMSKVPGDQTPKPL